MGRRDLEGCQNGRMAMILRWQIILPITIILRKKILTDLHTIVPSQVLLGFVQTFWHLILTKTISHLFSNNNFGQSSEQLISDEMPAFGHNPTPGTRPEQDRLQPFGEEIGQFFPEVDIEHERSDGESSNIYHPVRRPKDPAQWDPRDRGHGPVRTSSRGGLSRRKFSMIFPRMIWASSVMSTSLISAHSVGI